MSVLRCAPSCHVEINATPVSGVPLMPAGFRILAALDNIARNWFQDIEVTSVTEGQHSGPNDPHKKGEAVDVRSNNLPSIEMKQELVKAIIVHLCAPGEQAFETSGGWANPGFFCFLEGVGTPNEHAHVQRRRGTTYP